MNISQTKLRSEKFDDDDDDDDDDNNNNNNNNNFSIFAYNTVHSCFNGMVSLYVLPLALDSAVKQSSVLLLSSDTS